MRFPGWLKEKAVDGAMKRLPVIDRDACSGCGLCLAACPAGSLGMVWSFATLLKPETCLGEGKCATACPEGLIRMEPGRAEA